LSSELRRIAAALDSKEREIELPQRPRGRQSQSRSGSLGWIVGALMLAAIVAAWWYLAG
jgi:hypothetical protein